MEDIIDVLFALDVIYTFRTAYLDPQGEMVRDGGKIVSNYLGSWFPIDILASLPLEYIVLVFGLSGGTNLTYFAFLKVQLLEEYLLRTALHTDGYLLRRLPLNTEDRWHVQTPRLLRLGRLLRFLEKIKNANVRIVLLARLKRHLHQTF